MAADLAQAYDVDARHEAATRADIARLLEHHAADSKSPVLDVGTGTGALLAALRDTWATRVVGVDTSLAMLGRAPVADADVSLVVADAVRLPFQDDSFALVASLSAWHLFPDKSTAMAEFARVTSRQQGLVAIVDVTPEDLARQVVHQLFPEFHAHERTRHSTVEEVKALASGAGLRQVATRRFPFSVRLPSRDALIAFVASRPFFGMRSMDDDMFQEGFVRFVDRTATQLPIGSVVSESAITASLFTRAPAHV